MSKRDYEMPMERLFNEEISVDSLMNCSISYLKRIKLTCAKEKKYINEIIKLKKAGKHEEV